MYFVNINIADTSTYYIILHNKRLLQLLKELYRFTINKFLIADSFHLVPIFEKNKMATTKITVNNNGSLKIEGNVEVVDRNGGVYNLQGREIVSFCRCGLSKNKPFCDGSHNGHFEHEAIAFDLPPKKTV
jgi:CDGSH-type Zn-finger protein